MVATECVQVPELTANCASRYNNGCDRVSPSPVNASYPSTARPLPRATEASMMKTLKKMAKNFRACGFSRITPQNMLLVLQNFPLLKQALVHLANELIDGKVHCERFDFLKIAMGIALGTVNEFFLNLLSKMLLEMLEIPFKSNLFQPYRLVLHKCM
jgi:hypothetical protein